MRQLNIKLVAWLIGGSILLVVGVYFLHNFQMRKNTSYALKRAAEAEEKDDPRLAVRYYDQYLKSRDDEKVYASLAAAHKKVLGLKDVSGADYARAQIMIEQAVRLHPDLKDARLQLIDMYLTLYVPGQPLRPRDAADHITYLKKKGIKDPSLDVKYGSCLQHLNETSQAAKIYADLIGYNKVTKKFADGAPGAKEPDAYFGLAGIYRTKLDSPTEADRIMDRMLEFNKDSARAYRHHGLYLQLVEDVERPAEDSPRSKKLKQTIDADFARAIELAPNDEDIIFTAGKHAMNGRDFEQAHKLFERGAKLFPKQATMSFYAALCLDAMSKREQAIEFLKSASKDSDPVDMRISFLLAWLQMNTNELEAARATIKQFEERNKQFPELAIYLNGRMAVFEKDWLTAIAKLEKARPLIARLRFALPPILDIDGLLGEAYFRTRQYDLCKRTLQRALEVNPSNEAARNMLAAANQATGNSAAARDLTQKPASPQANEIYAAMLEELQKPENERNWTKVDALVKKEAGSLNEVQKTMQRIEVEFNKQNPELARKLLAEASQKFPKEPAFWILAVQISERQKKSAEALAILEQAEKSMGDVAWLRRLRLSVLRRSFPDQLKQELPKLEKGVDQFADYDQVSLLTELAATYENFQDNASAARVYKALLEKTPSDNLALQRLFDVAMRSNDKVGMKEAQERIGKVLTEESHLYKYAEAWQLILPTLAARFPTRSGAPPQAVDVSGASLERARRIATEGIQLRPDWPEFYVIMGQIEFLENDQAGAAAHYKQAFDKGSVNRGVARQLIVLLYALGRTDEIEPYIRYARPIPAGDPLNKVLLEVQFKKQPEETLKQAKQLVLKADDAATYFWFAQLAARGANTDEAIEALRKSLEKDPKNADAWVMLVGQLVTDRQGSKAEEEIRRAGAALPEDVAALTMAKLYEISGDNQLADKKYREALKAHPKDIRVLSMFSMYLLHEQKYDEAIAILDQILEDDSRESAAQRAVARRAKADVLSQRGGYSSFKQALDLLDQNSVDGKLPPMDLLVKARMLARRPESAFKIRAVDLLLALQKEQGQLAPTDQLALAIILNDENRWKESREQMESLVERTGENPLYLAGLAKMLLQHDELYDEVAILLDRLDKVDPKSTSSKELRAWLMVKQGQAEEAKQLLKKLEPPSPLAADQFPRLASLADTYRELGFFDDAERMLRRYVAEQPRAVLLLAAFVGQHGSLEESFKLFEEAQKSQPMDKVISASLGVLRGRPDDVRDADYDQIEKWIKEAIESENDELQVWTYRLLLADLRDLQNRNAEVAKIYREFLASGKGDEQQRSVYKNNLAYYLALDPKIDQKPGEPLKLIDEAIQALGATSDLMDTRAMANYAAANFHEAVVDSRVAIAAVPSALKYFHLALFEFHDGGRDAALKAWNKAAEEGLKPGRLPRFEKPFYDTLYQQLGPPSTKKKTN